MTYIAKVIYLLEHYYKGDYITKVFVSEFNNIYNLQLENSALSEKETKLLDELATITGRFSSNEEELKILNLYFSEKDVKEKATSVYLELFGTKFNKISNKELTKRISESKLRMNTLGIELPYSYVAHRIKLNWFDVLFAIHTGYFSLESAIEHAGVELEKNEEGPQTVLDLVCLYPYEMHLVHPYIKELASTATAEEKKTAKDKILFVVLNWLFEHRQDYEDPLILVEIVYDDFGFPKSIENLVRYRPSGAPDLGSLELNQNRIFERWQNYISAESKRFSPYL